MSLRQLVFETVGKTEGVETVEVTLKWGEPGYIAENGSTVRMDRKERSPKHYAMYFHCTTTLVDTFRELYRDTFTFEGNRAIIFHEDEEIPADQLKHCIALMLIYHDRKYLPNAELLRRLLSRKSLILRTHQLQLLTILLIRCPWIPTRVHPRVLSQFGLRNLRLTVVLCSSPPELREAEGKPYGSPCSPRLR